MYYLDPGLEQETKNLWQGGRSSFGSHAHAHTRLSLLVLIGGVFGQATLGWVGFDSSGRNYILEWPAIASLDTTLFLVLGHIGMLDLYVCVMSAYEVELR